MTTTLFSSADEQNQPTQTPAFRQKEVSVSMKTVLRSQRSLTKGIYIRLIIDGEFDYYPTGYYIKPALFDCKHGVVKNAAENKDAINSAINGLKKELDDVLYTLKKSGQPLTVANFKSFFTHRFRHNITFNDFFALAIKEKQGAVEATSLEVYRRLKNRLEEFKAGVMLKEIDKKFIGNWEVWLLQGGRCQNTVNHYLETLRTFILIACEEKIITANPFNKIKIPKIIGERDYLSEEELILVKNLKIPKENTGEIRVRELFIFCCLTGVRYSDLFSLKWENVRKITNELHFRMHKTKIWLTIPLLKEAMEIIKKQPKEGEYIFKRISNQTMNFRLHTIEEKAGLQKNLTVHVARHTFATLSLERGIPIDVVSKYLGHKSLKMTMIYARVTNKRLHQEMQKMNGLATNPSKKIASTVPGSMEDVIAQMKTTIGLLEGQLKNSGVTNLRAV